MFLAGVGILLPSLIGMFLAGVGILLPSVGILLAGLLLPEIF